jgi:hypothetical protein
MKKLLKKIKNKSTLATIAGVTTAIATAWLTIDWLTFDIRKEWPKLFLSAIIAVGGYLSQFKSNKELEQ